LGSAHATSELKLDLLPVILSVQQHQAFTSLSIFVDGISFSASRPQGEETLDAAVLTFRTLRSELGEVNFIIAAEKTEAIASDGTLVLGGLWFLSQHLEQGAPILHKQGWCKTLCVDFGFVPLSSGPACYIQGCTTRRTPRPERPLARGGFVFGLNRAFRRRAALCTRMLRSFPHRPVVRYRFDPSLLHGTDLAPISALALHQARTEVARAGRIYTPGMALQPLLPLLGPQADPAFLAHFRAVLRIARDVRLLHPRWSERRAHSDRFVVLR
jgi:hypothetical protein